MGSNTSQPAKYDAPAYGCLITFFVLTSIAIAARGISRRILKAPFGADDALAYIAYVYVPYGLLCSYLNNMSRCRMPLVLSIRT
jgi:hypothetical protein